MSVLASTSTLRGRFNGRNAVVTGGANGIGRACARRLAAEGATIALLDVDTEKVASTAAELADGGRTALGYSVDVSDPAQVRDAFDDFERRSGRIDVLVNMAGIFPPIPFDELTLEDWERITAVNLDATFITCKDVLPRMRKHGYGRITTVSSGTVHLGWGGTAAYIAAKAGVIGLTRVLAREAGPDGITANVIMPGVIQTEATMSMGGQEGGPDEATLQGFVAQQCIPRLGQPADVAEAVAYVASEGASFLTGQTINVGGGFTFL
jgi:3-oxoacyl-[acyl-carrier protein] reductase